MDHVAAHVGEDFDETHVSLKAALVQARDRHFAAGDRRGCEEVAGGGSIRLDVVLAQANVPARILSLADRGDLLGFTIGLRAAVLSTGDFKVQSICRVK